MRRPTLRVRSILAQLRALHLYETRVSDAGMEFLAGV
jgi:hypothetical protein